MSDPSENKDKKYPKGHFVGMWTGIGIALFAGIGVPLSVATGNNGLIGIGPAIGVSFGAGIGQAIEKKYEREGKIRPLTPAEQKRRKRLVWVGTVVLALGLLALLWVVLTR
jgi:hypothetical protein